MIFPQLVPLNDFALLLLRIMVGIGFMTSGWKHLQDPEERKKDFGMSKGFTIVSAPLNSPEVSELSPYLVKVSDSFANPPFSMTNFAI
jgi:uncharacterized membrane protein YphA (DoxX/SURF4 family)